MSPSALNFGRATNTIQQTGATLHDTGMVHAPGEVFCARLEPCRCDKSQALHSIRTDDMHYCGGSTSLLHTERTRIMVRMKFSIQLAYQVFDPAADFILNVHAAQTSCQTVVSENLGINQAIEPEIYTEPMTGTRYMRLQAVNGPLTVRYDATVDIEHGVGSPDALQEMPIAQVPTSALPFIYPSRYCQSDRLRKFAFTEFGNIPHGYHRVQAIQDWVRARTTFLSGSTNASTSAVDTIIEQAGVCRDFTHLMIALCRALNIPARFVSGIDYGADPAMGPTDFHAYVEVMLSGRWYLFDPSGVSPPMGLVRLGTGRDAADVSFATVFGAVGTSAPVISIEAIVDEEQGWLLPQHRNEVFSTHSGVDAGI
jgi:transglutaminase-like putative cysteine protease